MATMESIASQVDDLRQNMAPHDEFVANRSKVNVLGLFF